MTVQPIDTSAERLAAHPPTRDDDEDQADDADLPAMLDELGRAAAASVAPGEGMPPLAAGTFAFYPDGNGGLVMVMDIRDGAFPTGIHRGRIPSGMIRAVGVLANGGGKLAALKALTTGGRRGRG